MLKKTITFKDFGGNDVTEDFYFNLSKAEIVEMETSVAEGLSERFKRIVEGGNAGEIMGTFRDILRRAYGKRSDDMRRFIKTPELFEEFAQTEAYSELFMELATNANSAAEFIAGILPQDVVNQAANAGAPLLQNSADATVTNAVEVAKSIRPQDMTREQLLAAYQEKLAGVVAAGVTPVPIDPALGVDGAQQTSE